LHAFLKSLAWLEPVVELARLAIFLAFVALVVACIVVHVRSTSEEVRRRAARLLIGYVVVITTLVGVIQIDAWPFTTWALVHTLRAEIVHSWVLEGVTAEGKTVEVDPRVLQPIAPEELGGWLPQLPRLPAARQREVMRFLYERSEVARADALAGKRFPPNDWLLGELSAPYHFAARRPWRTPADVPRSRFVSVRLVGLQWSIPLRARLGDRAIARTVWGTYP
jgi:hypothetical protein